MGERVPQHIQNQVIREYCLRNQLNFLLSSTEYAMLDSQLILDQVLVNLEGITGIVAYSLFQLPRDSRQRKIIYEKLIVNKKTFHFAVEGIKATSKAEFDRIEMFWNVKNILPFCPKIEDIRL